MDEIFLGHVRLDREMALRPSGERLKQAIRHGLLPPIAKMHATQSEEGFSVIYPQLLPKEDIKRTFKTEEEMRAFLKKMGATLYPVKSLQTVED